MTGIRILLCMRVAENDEPLLQSVVRACSHCGAAIWVANSSPPVDRRICIQCVATDPDFKRENIQPLTAEQRTDIERWRQL